MIPSIDVCILAGGHGSRLAGVWDKAKCLAPIGPEGTPLLKLLLDEVLALRPRVVFLLLGIDRRAEEVAKFVAKNFWSEIEAGVLVPRLATPTGTASALRAVIPFLRAPVLVLNGDTLPLYGLERFLLEANYTFAAAAYCVGTYAGAMRLDKDLLQVIAQTDRKDMDYYLPLAYRFQVHPGFYDIGTPSAFSTAHLLSITQ